MIEALVNGSSPQSFLFPPIPAYKFNIFILFVIGNYSEMIPREPIINKVNIAPTSIHPNFSFVSIVILSSQSLNYQIS